ncbi:multidrug effflux MFS transporter [Photobacterium lutimaris]|uniref:Bcr/CflA family efflux transporter n=1 Tax=Photobacterium lutimaris TaxID=388278 RepID=A0A2T3J352_9GAMM|nr:multidrug effflux MFS transporter [Photobacterium lutimaris]PSU35710.1 hypothetical protein C9I99_01445 [Photobacterium lutimaris]TDR78772.1 DHA1 family bicyclomycin/chloramphenicol resistance-like MFS transporter/DHA1 family 2-module integral membrane pump EmrD-like MFS transporter [Photobacterium lutimaris]
MSDINKAQKTLILSLLVILCTIPSLASDSYLPALPLMTEYFATTTSVLQYSVSIYFVGFAIAQLAYGPASDYYGRKPLIIFGLIIALLGSAICALSTSISTFLLGRLVLGIGVAASIPIGRVILTDLYDKKDVSKAASLLNSIFAVLPAFSPILGAYLVKYFDWQSTFIFVLILSVLVLLLILRFLPETNQQRFSKDATKGKLLANYRRLFASRSFVAYSLCTCLAYAGVIAYTTSSPFLFQSLLGLTMEQFSWLTITITLSYITGGWLNNRLIDKHTIDHVIAIGLTTMLLSSLSLTLIGVVGILNLYALVIPMCFFMVGTRLIFANAMAGALSDFRGITGVASSLYGFFQIAGSVLTSALIGYLPKSSQLPLALVLLVGSSFALCQFLYFMRQNQLLISNELN